MKFSKVKPVFSFIVGLVLSVACLTIISLLMVDSTNDLEPEKIEKQTSRIWMEYAENIVRETKPTPPASARLYAYVATAYHDALDTGNSFKGANAAVEKVLHELHPEYATKSIEVLDKAGGAEPLNEEGKERLNVLLTRLTNDGYKNEWDGKRPEGEDVWIGENPFSPAAGTWLHWILDEKKLPTVPPPPEFDSDEHKAAVAKVKETALLRTPEQSAAVNFWGGVPGTEAPAGIWQNRLFDETKEYNLSDKEYSYAQMVVAQTIADAFTECWRIKYTYWTKRPSMVDGSIDLAMNNPPFPSYVSGHSTISRAAAEVLSSLFPEKTEIWISDAAEARDSRLWGGIHYEYDNENGFVLGEKIGKIAINYFSLKPLAIGN